MIDKIELYCQDIYIREKLAHIRKSSGKTQKQIAEETGLSPNTISRIESGDCTYTGDSLIKYAEALGYEVTIKKKGHLATEDEIIGDE